MCLHFRLCDLAKLTPWYCVQVKEAYDARWVNAHSVLHPVGFAFNPEYLYVDMGANAQVSIDVVKYILGRGPRRLQSAWLSIQLFVRVRAFSQTNLSGRAQHTCLLISGGRVGGALSRSFVRLHCCHACTGSASGRGCWREELVHLRLYCGQEEEPAYCRSCSEVEKGARSRISLRVFCMGR